MIQTLYTGVSGLTGQQKNIDTIANNIANLNTDGYKKTRFDFQDCLYSTMRAPSPASNGPEKNLQRGNGAIELQTAHIFLEGSLSDTGRVLDFAIEGKGFFVVENPLTDESYEGEADQSVQFVRNGNFHISNEEEGAFLVDSAGRYILNTEGERISLPQNMSIETLRCSPDGTLSYADAQGTVTDIARLQVVDFVNPGGLADAGNGAFVQTDNSGEMLEIKGSVLQRKLESSNVDYSDEVTRLIRAQRAYQLAARAVTTADQMMGLANSIRQ